MKFLVINVVLNLCLIGVLGTNSSQSLSTKSPRLVSHNEVGSPKDKIEGTTNSQTAIGNIKKLVCPSVIERIPFLSLPCDHDSECKIFGNKMVCCLKRCIKGVNPSESAQKAALDRSSEPIIISTSTEKTVMIIIDYVCPSKNLRIPFFSLPCQNTSDCMIFGNKMVCCSNRCIDGIPQKRMQENISGPNVKQVTEKTEVIERSSDQPVKLSIQKIVSPQSTQNKSDSFICPEGARIPFFGLLCTNNNDCKSEGNKMVCCKNRCITGVPVQKNEIVQNVRRPKEISEKIQNENSILPPRDNNTIDNTSGPTHIEDHKTNNLVCPEKGARIPFFSYPCVVHSDCESSGKEMVCCSSRCIKGVLPKKPEIVHSPSWFGLVERNCPVDAIVEILEIKECESDADCRPRICCPDKYRSGGNRSYCRTPQPSLHRFPLAERATEPLRVFASYIQCTPPPPPIFDLFPKPCNNALDCFPNLCCQEGDKKYCRPPKRSVLQLIAGVGQRFVPADAAKRLIERLN